MGSIMPSKRMRNKIAGFITHLMKRIQHRPIRNISLRLQEEERERRLDFVPDRSAIDFDQIEIDKDTQDMLETINVPNLLESQVVTIRAPQADNGNRGPRRNDRRN